MKARIRCVWTSRRLVRHHLRHAEIIAGVERVGSPALRRRYEAVPVMDADARTAREAVGRIRVGDSAGQAVVTTVLGLRVVAGGTSRNAVVCRPIGI